MMKSSMINKINLVSVDPNSVDRETIDRALNFLSAGGLLVAPTETKYGLLGRSDKKSVLEKIYNSLDKLTELKEETIENIFKQAMEETGLKMVKVAQPVRVALTGSTASPGIFEVISLIGKNQTLQRLEKAINHIKAK